MKYLLIVLLFSLSLFSKDIYIQEVCYKLEKKDFISTLKIPVDLKIDISSFYDKKEKEKWLFLSFLSKEDIPYANEANSFFCMKDEKYSYECVGDDDGGRMYLDIKDNEVFLNIKYAIMAETPDDPIIHEVKSKNSTFSRPARISCVE